jgi:adenosine deaminase
MSNAELIEQTASLLVTVAYAHQEFDNYDHVLHHGNVKKLTEALEAADKRISELERKLAVAREALNCVVTMPRSAESIRRCTQALAQIGEKDE